MSAISANLTSPPDNFSTTLSSGISDSDLTIPLNSVAGLATEGVGVLFTKDANGDVMGGSVEIIHWTGVSGSSLTLTNTGDRGLTGSDAGAQAYSSGAYFEVWVTSYYYKSLRDGAVVEHNTDGTHKLGSLAGKTTPVDADSLPIVDSAASNVLKLLTWANLKATLLTWLRLSTTIIPQNAPQGFLINGKIVVTDTGSGLTVAIKGLDGNDPSATNPVYCRIGDTVRTISVALSKTLADGTSWFNAGSAELATKEIDFPVFLSYNATDGVVIGFARFFGSIFSDFSTTSTNEKYLAYSGSNAAASDPFEVIGRFAATLSAGAGYTWSVPTFTASNLIQRPVYETRELILTPVFTGFSSNPTSFMTYKLIGNQCFVYHYTSVSGTSNANTFTVRSPLATTASPGQKLFIGIGQNNGVSGAVTVIPQSASNVFDLYNGLTNGGTTWTASGVKYAVFSSIYTI